MYTQNPNVRTKKHPHVPGHTMRMRAPRTDVTTRSLSRPHLTDDARWESRSPSFSSASSPRRRCAFSWYVYSRARDKPRVGSHVSLSHSRAVREMSNPATRRHSGSLASRRPVRRARSFVERRGWIEKFFMHSLTTRSFTMRRRARRGRRTMGDRSRSDGSVRCCVGAPPMGREPMESLGVFLEL